MKAMIQMNETISCNGIPVVVEKPETPRHAETDNIRLLTEQKLAEHLMICRRQLYNWRMAGLIPYLKLGKAVRFRLSDVERVLETLTIGKP
jgi:predicted DNA-binding transcriptional regulator AlpA